MPVFGPQRKPPMTADEAREAVEIMRRETPVPAQKVILRTALSHLGNLLEEAKAVYRARLAELEAQS